MSFSDIAAVMAEHTNTFDELRIIAGEAHLKKSERDTLRRGAQELEDAQRELISLHVRFIELQGKMIAVNDQLIEARQKILTLLPKPQAYPTLSLTISGPLMTQQGW